MINVTALLYGLIHSGIVWLYIAFFLLIALIKWWRRKIIVLNGIWFSHDGTIPADVIENLSNLAETIRSSPYKKNYHLFFFTHLATINSQTKKQLKRHGIKVKDYRKTILKDKPSLLTADWIQKFLALGDKHNPLFFCMASDLLRLYLLLRFYPTKRKYHYAIYFDCNDINFNTLPKFNRLEKVKSLAFHFVQFNYNAHDIFKKLMNNENATFHTLLTNDVIVTRNHRNKFFDKLFNQYQQNLSDVHIDNFDFIETLTWTKNTMGIIDFDLLSVLVFTTTHMSNILRVIDNGTRTELLEFCDNQLQLFPTPPIQDAAQFLSFVRDYDKGMTWALKQETAPDSDLQAQCRAFWYNLFLLRNNLRTK